MSENKFVLPSNWIPFPLKFYKDPNITARDIKLAVFLVSSNIPLSIDSICRQISKNTPSNKIKIKMRIQKLQALNYIKCISIDTENIQCEWIFE